MEYTIAVGIDPHSLTKSVNNYIKMGWEPHGSLVIDPVTKLYMQTVLRES